MHDAAADEHTEVVEILYTFGADLEIVDNDGRTPLLEAVWYCRAKTAQLLLELKADATKSDQRGRTILQTKNKEMKQLFLEYSKKSVRLLVVSCEHSQFFIVLRNQDLEKEETRIETSNRIRYERGIRLMQYAQPEIVGICLAFASLELPPYILLWIVDWLPNYDKLSHRKKIHLIESVRSSIWKIKR